ncbi:hypothetical protein C8R44DRAFT_748154 [Mycena epipterygia]|nr:hypothetical protein C8R44DRAFT_748154 [Mycena epipterygia]
MHPIVFLQAIPLLVIVGVQAIDNRLLYTSPRNETIDSFRTCFENTCSAGTWKPANHAGLTFRGFIFEPGDFSGQLTDTEARLACSWYNVSAPNLPFITFTQDVAKYLGATKT